MRPIKDEIRERMREQFAARLRGVYSYSRGSLPTAYQHIVELVTTERCFDLMREAGCVEMDSVADDLSVDDLFGDCYCPKSNPDINPNVLSKQRQEALDRMHAEGVWFVESRYRDAGGDGWHDADGIGGFVGNDFYGSGYEIDVWRAALEGYAQQFDAPTYRECHPDPLQRGPVFLAALRMCGADLDIPPDIEERYLRVT